MIGDPQRLKGEVDAAFIYRLYRITIALVNKRFPSHEFSSGDLTISAA